LSGSGVKAGEDRKLQENALSAFLKWIRGSSMKKAGNCKDRHGVYFLSRSGVSAGKSRKNCRNSHGVYALSRSGVRARKGRKTAEIDKECIS